MGVFPLRPVFQICFSVLFLSLYSRIDKLKLRSLEKAEGDQLLFSSAGSNPPE